MTNTRPPRATSADHRMMQGRFSAARLRPDIERCAYRVYREAVRRSGWVMVLFVALGCSSELGVEVELVQPVSPDPFEGVQVVRLRALEGGQPVTVGEGRWDQGALDLPVLVSPAVERFIVEGLDDAGRIVSSGASAPLDLLTSPPDGAVRIMFTRVGVLSILAESGPPRRGGRAVHRADDTVLFLGGAGGDGCLHSTTEIYSSEPPHLVAGPPMARGRINFSTSKLPDGRVLVTGGQSEVSCSMRSPDLGVVFLDGRSARSVAVSGFEVPGVALAVMPSSEIIVAGGEGELVARTDVTRFDPSIARFRTIGVLDGPRAFASATAISGARVALLGGRSQRGSQTALESATVFVPSRGAALEERIGLGLSLIAPAVTRTLAGGILFAGGRKTDDRGHAAVRMLVVRTERDFPLGDTTAVTSMSSTVANGSLIDVGDGSHLLIGFDRPVAHWIQLLPRRARALRVLDAPLVGGGGVADGRVVLRDEEGRFFSFNAGVPSVAGVFAKDGVLGVTEGEQAASQSAGVVPLRPNAWRLTTRGLDVTGPPSLEGDITPEERALLVGVERADFDMAFDLRLEPRSRAAFVFAADLERYDHVVLGARTSVHRSDSTVQCATVDVPTLDDGGVHRVRVQRTDDRIVIAIDEAVRLDCEGVVARRGRMGFGLVGGSATFERLTLGVP